MGYIFNLLASVCWGLMGVFSVKATKKIHPLVAAFVSTIAGLVLLTIVVAFLGLFKTISGVGTTVLILLAAAGITEYALGRTMMFLSMKNMGTARTAPIANTSMLLAPIFATFLLNETLPPKVGLGLLCAFFGTLLITRGQQ